MGKKHSGIKTYKKGEFKELAPDQIPANIKAMLGEQDEDTSEKAISGKERDFVQRQKSYHLSCIGIAILGAELEVFMEQVSMKPEERSIKWNGMIMPEKVLHSHTLLKNSKYIEGIHEKESLKKSLLNDGLTLEQIDVAGSDGHYVKELPTKINTGEVASEVNQG